MVQAPGGAGDSSKVVLAEKEKFRVNSTIISSLGLLVLENVSLATEVTEKVIP
jgi:hypothetical protein